ncbi:MAG: segregation/condensation protein A [Rhodobacteraceae bacterium]|nr:segregation/condensation protein A [Paracoccaceae bacterium]
MQDSDEFEAPERDAISERLASEALIIDVEGYEGPLDLLLTMSRTQKVDLRQISVLALARQYLVFIDQAVSLRIELAADYLVMAAWLAFLKSRLLLPPDPTEDGPSGEELAAHLAFQLERLAAMRDAAAKLMARDQKGRDFFVRGITDDVTRVRRVTYTATLLELMQAYARIRTKDEFRPYVFDREAIMSMEQALERLRLVVGSSIEWVELASYLPPEWAADPARRRSATAATFAASLELAKEGKVEIKQSENFAPVHVRTVLGRNAGPDR